MRLKGKVVVEPSNADPSIFIDLALSRANEDVTVLASSYKKKISERVNGNEYVSPRILWLRVKIGLTWIFTLGVYAPNMSKLLEERQEFWGDVSDILVKCDWNEKIVMLSDFNGLVGVQRDGYQKVLVNLEMKE
ncbi:hypothetical protein EVAR_12697_1 [Eumeta japonica]|uniref:Craniofacial development protein 2 n=1 Tax=Eumeta variegata TaxID=151549 RepID=A0A4C1UMI2_EUMVA|nr:hypothetical protein EVAR_12697_1 [Eumeta japonica]